MVTRPKGSKGLQATARERRSVFASLLEAVKTHSLGQISQIWTTRAKPARHRGGRIAGVVALACRSSTNNYPAIAQERPHPPSFGRFSPRSGEWKRPRRRSDVGGEYRRHMYRAGYEDPRR